MYFPVLKFFILLCSCVYCDSSVKIVSDVVRDNLESAITTGRSYMQGLLELRNVSRQTIIKFLDASSKLPSGILNGHIADLGDFDECLDIDESNVQGQYCLVTIPLPNLENKNDDRENNAMDRGIINLISVKPKLYFAICVPSSWNMMENGISASNMIVDSCQTKNNDINNDWNAGDYVMTVFLGFILIMILGNTIYDIYLHRNKQETYHPIFIAFSLFTNGRKLFTTTHNANQLSCLNGIRFISMMWVIIGHVYYADFFTPTTNNLAVKNWTEKWTSMYIIGATVSVDTFFVIGGLLLPYVYLSAKEKGLKFNVFFYYLHRYLRLTPSLAVVVFIHMGLIRFMGSGPLWPDTIRTLQNNCQDYWWSTLLYVQNYVNVGQMCIGQTWYLSVDMQLFILSPLVLVPMVRYPKAVLCALGFLIILSVVSPFTIAWIYSFPGLMSQSMGNPDNGRMYYYNTYARFGPWVLGVMLGYFVYWRKSNRKLNQFFENYVFCAIGWIVSISAMLTIIFAQHNMQFHPYNRVESSLFLGLHRVAWSACLCYVVYACVTGHGGIVNDFLSLPIFQVLARLTYSMYLLHLSLIFMNVGRLRTAKYFSDIDNLYKFWADFMVTLVISVVWTLFFESPMICIEKILFGTGKKK